MEYDGKGDTNCGWWYWNNSQRIDEWTRRFANKRTSRDDPDYSIIKIGQNIGNSQEKLRRLAITKTPVRNHQLTLVWKTLKGVY